MITQSDLKFVKSLTQRKFRQKYNKFIAEGDKISSELLNAGVYGISHIYCLNEWAEVNSSLLTSFKQLVTIVSPKDLGRLSQLKTANQVLLVVDLPQQRVMSASDIESETAIYLDDVQDPGNVGTIIRIADWFGVKHVIRSAGTADFYSPKVVQSSMASLANVRLHAASTAELATIATDHDVVGAVLGGDPLSSHQWSSQTIIVMGNESRGITTDTMPLLTKSLMIPGSKDRLADSLNVGIATALMCQSWCSR